VLGDHLYLSLGDSVVVWSFKEKSWSQLALPAEGQIIPWRLGSRLFFTTPDSILERAQDGSIRVLASRRRQPSMTLLDDVENYDHLHLFMSANGTLHATLHQDVYALPVGSDRWQHLDRLPHMVWSDYQPFEDGFIALNADSLRQGWGMLSHSTAPELLFPMPVPAANRLGAQPAAGQQAARGPRWSAMLPSQEFCLQDDSVWCLVNSPPVQQSPSPNFSLFYFKTADPTPVVIPVQFVTNNPALSLYASLHHHPAQAAPGISLNRDLVGVNARLVSSDMSATPEGLVLIHGREPGFWFIPKADLDQALAHAAASFISPAKP
jgi:hypothetical protein